MPMGAVRDYQYAQWSYLSSIDDPSNVAVKLDNSYVSHQCANLLLAHKSIRDLHVFMLPDRRYVLVMRLCDDDRYYGFTMDKPEIDELTKTKILVCL